MKSKNWEFGEGFPDYPNTNMRIVEPIKEIQIHFCTVCQGAGTTKHHLIPKAIRISKPKRPKYPTIRLCRKCHDDVHFYFSHWELLNKYHDQGNLILELDIRKKSLSEKFGH